jgi:hypothetical protein
MFPECSLPVGALGKDWPAAATAQDVETHAAYEGETTV